ncbi:MAG: tetratricopeptide repeat protein [bacterium]
MKEPDDVLVEIRKLLGEDIEKVEEEESKEVKEEHKVQIEEPEKIDELLYEIEKQEEEGFEEIPKEPPLEIVEEEKPIEEEKIELEMPSIEPTAEEEISEEEPLEEEPKFDFEQVETAEPKIEEPPFFEPQEPQAVIPEGESYEQTPSIEPPEEEEIAEEKPPEEEPKFEPVEQVEIESEIEKPLEISEPQALISELQISKPESRIYEKPEEIIQPEYENLKYPVKEEFKEPSFDVREEPIEPEERFIEEEKILEGKTIAEPSKEQEEMKALLKEEKKKKVKLPKKPIKINKKFVFIPLFILVIIGIIGALGFLFFLPNKELKNAISNIEKQRTKEGEQRFNKWIGFIFLKNQKISFYHQVGEAYLSINEHKKAGSIFWKAYEIDTSNQNTHNYILSSTLKTEGWEKVKKSAEKILLKDPRSIPAHLILSRYLSRKGEIKEAISSLEKGLKVSPSNISLISFLQVLYFQDKQYDKLISLHRFLIDHLKNNPLNPDIVVKASGYFIEKGKLNIGKPPLEEILKVYPKNIEARYLLSLAYVKEGKKEEAEKELNGLLKDEGYPPAYNTLGEILVDKGKYMDALSAFSSAILKDPYFGKAHYNLADCAFYNLNDYSTSINGYEDARKNGYTTTQLPYNLGISYYIKGNYKKARNEFESLPKDKTILYNIAIVDIRLKNFKSAKEGFKGAESIIKERLREKISPKEEKGLYSFLSNIYNNLGLIAYSSGLEMETQERYWDAINTAKLAGFENKEAFSNLTNFFNGKPSSLSSLSDKLDKEYIVGK